MSQCPTDDELIAMLFDDASHAVRVTWESHLATCAACQERMADFRRTESITSAVYSATAVRSEWMDKMKTMIAEEASPSRSGLESSKPAQHFSGVAWLAATVCLATAATILVLVSASLRKPKVDTSIHPANEMAQSPIEQLGSSESLPEPNRDIVKPVGDYLVARDPQSDDSFELYWVLPVQN